MRCGQDRKRNEVITGVWLSLARAPGLGPGGRRFESCHPDMRGCSSMVEHQPSKLDTWVRFPSPAFSQEAVRDQAKGYLHKSL